MNLKRIIYIVLALALVGGAVGVYMWNKPHAKVEDAEGVAITAANLCNAFASNEAEATRQYTNKVLDISGVVTEVKDNQEGKAAITLAGNDMASVQCTMRDAGATAQVGKSVTIRGRFSSVDMFGPTLTDCVLK
jgi:hypothetical protein